MLRRAGVNYAEHELKRNTMVPVTLSPGLGLRIDWDRGDIVHASLISGSSIVAKIKWMSKGSYDNECSITPCNEKTELGDGWIKTSSKRQDYVDKANDYYERQFRGAYQPELDQMFVELQAMYQLGYPEVERLQAQSGDERMLHGPFRAAALTFTKPFA